MKAITITTTKMMILMPHRKAKVSLPQKNQKHLLLTPDSPVSNSKDIPYFKVGHNHPTID